MKKIIMTYIDYVSKVSVVENFQWLERGDEILKKENNINYLGELLERWESRGFNYLDVLKYAATTSNIEHNTNQVDNFIELTEKIIFDKEFTLANLEKELNQEFIYVYLHMVNNLKPEYLLSAYEKFLNFYKGIDVVFMDIITYFTTGNPIYSEILLNKKHPLRAQLITFIKENKIDLIKYIGARNDIGNHMIYTLGSDNIDCIIYKYLTSFIKMYSITKRELEEKEYEGYRNLKQFGKITFIEDVDDCVFLFQNREVAFLTNLLMVNARYSIKSTVKSEKIDCLKEMVSSVLQWDGPFLQYIGNNQNKSTDISLGYTHVNGCITKISIYVNIQDCNCSNCDIERFSDFILNYYGCYSPCTISFDILCSDIFIRKIENYIKENKTDTENLNKITNILYENLSTLREVYPANADILLRYLNFFNEIDSNIHSCKNSVYLWAILNGVIIIERENLSYEIKEAMIRQINRGLISKLENGYEVVIKELIDFAIQEIGESEFIWWSNKTEYSFLEYLLTCKSIHLEKEELINIQTIFIKSGAYDSFLNELILNSDYCEMLEITEDNLKELFLYLTDKNKEASIENLNKKFINLDVYEKRKALKDIEDSLKSLQYSYCFENAILEIEKNRTVFTLKEIEQIKYRFVLKSIPKIEEDFVYKIRLLIKYGYISEETSQKWLHIILKKGELHE